MDKAFDVLDTASKPVVTHLGAFDPERGNLERLGVDAGFFRSYVVDTRDSQTFPCDRRYAVLTCVEGFARIETADGCVDLGQTESCLIPASAGSYTIIGPCRVLRSVRCP